MTGRRGTAVATALLLAALAAAGCGLGPGADVGDVGLTVTREFGAVPVLDRSLAAKESDTVMRLLEGEAEVSTRYGGGFVHVDRRGGRGTARRRSLRLVLLRRRGGVADRRRRVPARGGSGSGGTTATGRRPTTCRRSSAPGRPPSPTGSAASATRWRSNAGSRGSFRTDSDRKEPRIAGGAQALEREGVKVASGEPERRSGSWSGPGTQLRGDPTARADRGRPGRKRGLRGLRQRRRLRARRAGRRRGAGAEPRSRRRPRRRHQPLRRPAGLGRDRGDAGGGAGRRRSARRRAPARPLRGGESRTGRSTPLPLEGR